jgi:hypothetical protein
MRVDGIGAGLSLSATDKKSIEKLETEGTRVWKENEADLKKVVEQILDEKYGSS